jgi:hypothetical protein
MVLVNRAKQIGKQKRNAEKILDLIQPAIEFL